MKINANLCFMQYFVIIIGARYSKNTDSWALVAGLLESKKFQNQELQPQVANDK
ncbi:hypothetical protein OAU29_01175 [Porticoccaceae bacterium]|nr:hypothetical protein [Porticoccaceae bacterium]